MRTKVKINLKTEKRLAQLATGDCFVDYPATNRPGPVSRALYMLVDRDLQTLKSTLGDDVGVAVCLNDGLLHLFNYSLLVTPVSVELSASLADS